MIQWLHISDLHFKPGIDSDPDQSALQQALLNDCSEGKIQANFVVATGDFHNIYDTEDYNSAKIFLKKLISTLHLDIEKDFFLVPGNHDVNKELLQSDREELIARLLQTKFLTEDGNPDLAQGMMETENIVSNLLKAFEEYSIMVRDLMHNTYPMEKLGPETVHVRTWKEKINLIHLNTALISNGDRTHYEIVDINAACGEKIWENINQTLPSLVLAHHSFFDLDKSHRKRLVRTFNQHNVWAYLAGDQHRANFNDDHDYYINRKQDAQKTWPNLLADKLAASTNDNYSRFGVVCYQWDEHSEFSVNYLRWDGDGSGIHLTPNKDSIRHFPMNAQMNSSLYFDLTDRLIETRRAHPSFQLMEIDKMLYPKGLEKCKITLHGLIEGNHQSKPLAKIFQGIWHNKIQSHLLLEGEGGIGKTVSLLSLTSTERILPYDVPAVYIPLQELQVSKEWNSIDHYLLEQILDFSKEKFNELIQLVVKKWNNGPRLVMLLDGFNEVAQDISSQVARDIERWSKKRGVQLIIASRFDVSNYVGLTEAVVIRLTELSRDTVRNYLEKSKISVPAEDSLVWQVINYPLMLTLYTQTEWVQKQCRGMLPLLWKVADSAGNIIWNYLQKELFRCWKQGIQPALCVIIIEFVVPYIAWIMVETNHFFLHKEKIKNYIKQAIKTWTQIPEEKRPRHIQDVWDECGELNELPAYGVVYRIITQNLNIFRESKNKQGEIILRLMHQHFRDCFAALHLLNQATAIIYDSDLPLLWKKTVDYYVMNFCAELIKGDSHQQITAHQLWETNRIHPTNNTATRTMLELQSRLTKNDFSALNFSGMDLRKTNMHHYHLPGKATMNLPKTAELLKKTKISQWTFAPEGHGNTVSSIAVIPCKQQVISCSHDYTIRVWDVNTGTCLDVWRGHSGPVNALALSPDFSRCFTGSDDGTVRVWDVENGECINIWSKHSGPITALALTSDGTGCFTGSLDKTIRIWDVANGNSTILQCTAPITSLVITPEGTKCYIGFNDGIIQVWEINSKTCIATWNKHTKAISALALLPDDSICFSGSHDKSIRIWNTTTGKCLRTWTGHTGPIHALTLSPDGSKCFSGSGDDTIRVWNLKRKDCEKIWKGHLRSVYALALSPDGFRCFSGAWDHSIRVWDMCSGNCTDVWEGFTGAVNALVLSPDGARCFSGFDDGTLRSWDVESQTCTAVWSGHSKAVYALALSPDGLKCFSGSRDNTIRVWDIMTGKCIACWDRHLSAVNALVISPDGSTCFSGSRDNTIRVWDVKEGTCNVWKTLASVNALVLSPDGTKCFCGLSDKTIQVWDVNRGICEKQWRGHSDSVTALAISPDGLTCFSGSRDNTIRVWDTTTGEYLGCWNGHTDAIYTLKTSLDGSICFSGAFDNTIRVWDIKKGNCIDIWKKHTAWVNTLAISSNGITCFSGSDDLTIRIWNIKTGECVKVLHPIPGLSLTGVDLSQAVIDPFEYTETLRQNGAIVPIA